MSPKVSRHPYAYTLELLMLAVAKLPPTFSDERRKDYEKRFQSFLKDHGRTYEEIQRTIVDLGKESWAFRKAYEEMYARYGRASEEAFLLENLDRGVREKFEQFIHEGGKINYVASAKSADDLRKPSPFERYFSPEEKFAIEQALLVARDSARSEIDGLVTGKKRDEYEALVQTYAERQRDIEKKIEELRGLAFVSEKWRAEIIDRVRRLEEGWSVVDQGADLADLERETEYWKGTLGAFLHA